MKKIMNDAQNFVDETIEGILRAHPQELRTINNDLRTMVRADAPVEGKVAIATGGGSGHLPLFLGYVGKGLADGVAIGEVFASPNAQQMYNVTKAIDGGEGVLYLYGNYGGDVMNFDMAAEMAHMDDIHVETILVTDDIASAGKCEENKRRGVAGLVFAYKVAGAKADEFASLDEVAKTTRKAMDYTRTIGVALSSCIIPEVGEPTFEIGSDEIEMGMGIHGERGIERDRLVTADEITRRMVAAVLDDGGYSKDDEVYVMVNGLGATPKEELYIVYRKAHEILQDKGIAVCGNLIGEFATSMEMAGLSITIMKVDDELKRLMNAPAYSPFFTQFK